MWNQMGSQCPLVLIGMKVFGHDELTAKHYYFGCSRPPDIDGIEIFHKDNQAIKHCSFIVMFCSLVIFIKHCDPINIRRPWATEVTMFCSEFIMTKTFKPIKTRRLGHPFDFTSFSARPVLTLGQRRVDTCTCILHTFKNISCEPIDYSTRLALTGLNGVH